MLVIEPGILKRDIDGESVILSVEREEYFGLDDISSEFFDVLLAAPSMDAAVSQLASEFDVEQDVLTRDLQSFVAELSELGIASWQDGATPASS